MGVYKDFLGLAINKCFTPDLPANSPCVAGLDATGNLFSDNYPIQINMFTTNNGMHSQCCLFPYCL